jgi:hypothetical protein
MGTGGVRDGWMCCSRALLGMPARGMDFTMGSSAKVLLWVGVYHFWRERNWGCGAIGMETSGERSVTRAGSKDGRRSVGAKSYGLNEPRERLPNRPPSSDRRKERYYEHISEAFARRGRC